MDNQTVQQIFLDISRQGAQKTIYMVRGDTARMLTFTLTEHDKPYLLPKESKAVFTALKPDGCFLYNHCTVDGNTILYEVTQQTTATAGKVNCQLRIIGSQGEILSTPSFIMLVDNLIYNEEPILDSSTEFNALTTYVAELQEKVSNGDFNGKSIYIRGTVSDNSALDVKLQAAEAGDGYIVLSTGNLCVFDGKEFVDVGPFRGPQGLSGVYVGSGDMPDGYNVQIDPNGSALEMDTALDSGSNNPVANRVITKAFDNTMPKGEHGLGGVGKFVDDLNTAKNCGWYYTGESTKNLPGQITYGVVIVGNRYGSTSDGDTCVEVFQKIVDTKSHCKAQRFSTNDEWGQWEYIIAPLSTGTEYLTAKRVDGIPVYTKRIAFGAPPASGDKTVAHTISNLSKVVNISWILESSNSIFYYDASAYDDLSICVGSKSVTVTTTAGDTNSCLYITLEYTKE